MKHLILASFFFLFSLSLAQAQTNANIPGPENVLVVYKAPVDGNDSLGIMSEAIKDYYQNARNIPESNIVPLQLPSRKSISVGDWSDPHIVKLKYNNEYIQDSTWNVWDSTHCVDTAKFHAWQYFLDEIKEPIRQHLVNNNLTETIRYIVMCKGVPFKIQAGGPWSIPGNVSVDGLLCMLNTENYDNFIEAIFDDITSQCYAHCDTGSCSGAPVIENPYYNIDPNFEINERFIPDHYTGNWEDWDYKLSYLVSRLDGLSYDIITDIIDRSIDADTSGEKTWILDGGGPGSDDIDLTNNILTDLGFNTEYNDNKYDWITTSENEVIGYTSAGTHQGMPTTYIQDTLDFTYANGAVFNTYESYNGYSIGTLRRAGNPLQGLMTEFLLTGGTGGSGHIWEPYGNDISIDPIFFSRYALGYNLIDAEWQGRPFLTWRNVLVGDPLTRILYDYPITILTTDSTITGGEIYGKIVVPEGITLTINATNTALNFNRNARLIISGNLDIVQNSQLSFNNYTRVIINENGYVYVGNNSSLTFNNKSKLLNNNILNISEGTIVNINDKSIFSNKRKLFGIGTNNNFIEFNMESDSNTIEISNIDSLILNYCKITNGEIVFEPRMDSNNTYISINNSQFISSSIIFNNKTAIVVSASLSNNSFTDFSEKAIFAQGLDYFSLQNNSFYLNDSSNTFNGIQLFNCNHIEIDSCNFNNIGNYAIYWVEPLTTEEILLSYPSSLNINNCDIVGNKGIHLTNQLDNIDSVYINSSHLDCSQYGILCNDFETPLYIKATKIENAVGGISVPGGFAIHATNCATVVVQNDSLINNDVSVYLSQVDNPQIIDNVIDASGLQNPGAGIFSSSSNGSYRLNTITGHYNGIELGKSSPELAQNIITNNKNYGMYITSNSFPDLGESIVGGLGYPLTGYNEIYENGICEFLIESKTELYLDGANINLENGCNTIADDRPNVPLHCDYTLLIDGGTVRDTIFANLNYWGNHPEFGNDPSQRFDDDIIVAYDSIFSSPCEYSQGGGFLLMSDNNGNTIDTVYSDGTYAENLSGINALYSSVNEDYYQKNYTSAYDGYKNIADTYPDNNKSVPAYNQLFKLKGMLSENPGDFQELKNYYENKLSLVEDTIVYNIVYHLTELCDVAIENYETAIDNFIEIAEQNQGNDLGFYSTLNALTTSLLLDPGSQLNKSSGKYVSASIDDYLSKTSELLKKRYNRSESQEEVEIPEEYQLFQNYPNPFNPTTTIKYGIRENSKVKLEIFDILGRKVKTLVDKNQAASYYKVSFNAGKFASGVYIYRLTAKDFVSAKKMLLIK